MKTKKTIIQICGNIGVGKTVFLDKILRILQANLDSPLLNTVLGADFLEEIRIKGYDLIFEPVENNMVLLKFL